MVKIRNPRCDFTKECVYSAFVQLLEEKKYEDITITEIVKRAGVSRMAYYRHYKAKADILRSYCDDLFEGFLNEVNKDDPITLLSFTYRYFRIFHEHEKLFRSIQKARLEVMLLRRLADYLKALSPMIFKTSGDTLYERYFTAFLAGSVFGIHAEWMDGNMVESSAYMAQILVDFMKNLDIFDVEVSNPDICPPFKRRMESQKLIESLKP